jgi:drug/metabolite transporter (DMT)-like permease
LSPLVAVSLPPAALAALAAALCWTVSTLLWRRLPTALSPGRLNLLKNLLALGFLLPLVLGQPWQLPPRGLLLLLASGVVGIALGDSLFFAALRRLGSRRTLTIEAAGPALTTLVGVVLLQEWPGPSQLLGIALITLAVALVARGAASAPSPALAVARELPAGQAPAGLVSGAGAARGVGLALAGLVCGSLGALLSRSALLSGTISPLQSASMRLAAASVVLLPLLLRWRPRPAARRSRAEPAASVAPMALGSWPLLLVATLLGTSAGIVLQQAALAGLPGGLAVALLSTAPVMALPLAWWLEGDRPGWRGLAAGLAALAGVTLVVLPLGSA